MLYSNNWKSNSGFKLWGSLKESHLFCFKWSSKYQSYLKEQGSPQSSILDQGKSSLKGIPRHDFIIKGCSIPCCSDNSIFKAQSEERDPNWRTLEILLKSRLQIKMNLDETLCKRLNNIMHHVRIKMMNLPLPFFSIFKIYSFLQLLAYYRHL